MDKAEYYHNLINTCEAAYEKLAEQLTTAVPEALKMIFEIFGKNPLCLAVTSCLCLAAAFQLASNIVRMLKEQGRFN